LRLEYRICKAFIGLVLVVGAIKLWGPLATNHHQQAELTKLRIEKASLLTEHLQLSDYQHRLASDSGFEAAARKLNFLRDGERRLVFIPKSDKKKAASPPDKKRAASPTPKAKHQ
jgi:hypothetical protein